MLNAVIKYGAVRAKVMALYGRMLREEDIQRLCSCSGLGEAAAVLKSLPGWAGNPALTSGANAETLKNAVESSLIRDYTGLWRFCAIEDKTALSFILRRGEREAILHRLRALRAPCPPMNPSLERLLRDSGDIDMDALDQCRDFSGVLAAARKTMYAEALEALRPRGPGELPDYRRACVALENACYQRFFSYMDKGPRSRGRILLTELIGSEADWLNLVNILRIIKYFPDSASEGTALLIPVYNRLKPQLAEKLMTAKSWEQALSMLSGTSMGKMAAGLDFSKPERAYAGALEALCRKLIRLPEPSVCTAQAYLTLKELECNKIIRIIEAIDCGADPRSAL